MIFIVVLKIESNYAHGISWKYIWVYHNYWLSILTKSWMLNSCYHESSLVPNPQYMGLYFLIYLLYIYIYNMIL